ncbi:MAG: hypothetical protein ACRENG_16930, partial [bacterium]
ELRKALKKRDRAAVNQWLYRKTRGRIANLDEETYEAWIHMAQMWSFSDLKKEVVEAITALE